MTDTQVDAICLVIKELKSAVSRYAPMNSAHEGYAVLLEEMDELKAEVWKSPKNRDMQAMTEEAVQVGAMALRFLSDVCLKEAAVDKPLVMPIGQELPREGEDEDD